MNRPLSCLIVDDEPSAREVLEQYIADAPMLQHAASCPDALEAMEYLNDHPIDLLFLDINMPKLTGIDFLKTLPDPPEVILSTAYDDYALKGYELDVVDYLLKPFSFDRFLKAVRKAQERLSASTAGPASLKLKADGKLYRVPLNEICYIESLGDYVTVHLNDQKLTAYETLKNLEEVLPREHFARVHKSYIVRIPSVEYLEGNMLKVGDQAIPVGKTYKDKILQYFS